MEHEIIIERIGALKTLEQCAEMYPAAYNTEPWNDNWTTGTARALLTHHHKTPNFIGWIALRNNVIIGCAIGNIEPYYSGNIFILKEMFVAVSAQGSGVGSRLLSTMKEHMKTINVKTVMLFTLRPIFDFYFKSGFKEMETAGTMVYTC